MPTIRAGRVRPRWLWLVALGLAALSPAACSAGPGSVAADETEVTGTLEGHFGLFDELAVDVFWNAPDCHLNAYERGTFSREIDEPSCWVDGVGSGRAMDGPAVADFERIAEALSASGLDVEYFSVDRMGGKAGPGTFFVFNACDTYSFYGDQPPSIEGHPGIDRANWRRLVRDLVLLSGAARRGT